MRPEQNDLLAILRVGRDTSARGAGLSLRDALTRCRYRDVRPSFGPPDLAPLLRRHPDLVQDWERYSEDKRTSGGWYLAGKSIGRVGAPDVVGFSSEEEAVAEFGIRELDGFSSF
jgi:hypothetical protein